MTLQFKDTLNNLHFSGSRLESAKGSPIVDDEASSNNVGASIDGSGAERDLQ